MDLGAPLTASNDLTPQMVQLQAAPYKSQSDDYLAVASSFSLLMVFFCSPAELEASRLLPLLLTSLLARRQAQSSTSTHR